jgi:hypothetical protein
MPESVFTQTMPLLLAGGVCCVAGVLVDEEDLLAAAVDAAVSSAGALDSLLAAGAGLLSVRELLAETAGVASFELSADVAFLEGLFLEAADSELAAVLFGAAVSAVSAEALFFDRDFLVVEVSVFADESVEAVLLTEPSAASAVLLLFERDFFAVVAEPDPSAVLVESFSLAAVFSLADVLPAVELSASAVLLFEVRFLAAVVELSASVLSEPAAAFFLDLDVLVFGASAVSSEPLLEESADAAFFFVVFFFVVALVSD